MSGHTPGPWVIQDMSVMVPDEPYWIASEHPEWGLCSFASIRLGCTEAGELGDMKANALLIAAAPELLAALEEARDGLRWYQDSYPAATDGSDDEAMARIDAALAKATTPTQEAQHHGE